MRGCYEQFFVLPRQAVFKLKCPSTAVTLAVLASACDLMVARWLGAKLPKPEFKNLRRRMPWPCGMQPSQKPWGTSLFWNLWKGMGSGEGIRARHWFRVSKAELLHLKGGRLPKATCCNLIWGPMTVEPLRCRPPLRSSPGGRKSILEAESDVSCHVEICRIYINTEYIYIYMYVISICICIRYNAIVYNDNIFLISFFGNQMEIHSGIHIGLMLDSRRQGRKIWRCRVLKQRNGRSICS